jgi:hypothetical protein
MNIKSLDKLCLISLAFSVLFMVAFAEPSAKWIMTYGDTGDEEAYALTFGEDGYVFVGTTNSTGFGRDDAWLVKTDSYGNMEWNHTYGGPSVDIAYSIVATDDGGYALVGSTYSFGAGSADVWLVKVDSNGMLQWNQTYGGTGNDFGRSLIATSDGGYALLCSSDSYGAGGNDMLLVKTNAMGVLEWNQTYGGSGSESVSSIIETDDGGYTLAGSTTSFGAGIADFWLVKVDSSGNTEWNQTYGESGIEFANSIVATKDGGYALAGSTSSRGAGSADVWLIKVDSLGKLEWNQTYGGPIADYCDSMVSSSDDGYTLACISQDPIFGDGDFWLAKVDSLGNLLWNQTYGASAHHSQTSLLITTDGSYILGGSIRDSFGNHDFWLAKIAETKTEEELLFYVLIPIGAVLVLLLPIILKRSKHFQN